MSKVVRDYEGCSQEEICQLVEHLLGCTPLTTPPSIVQRHVARIHPRLPWQRRPSAILTFMFISTGAHGAAASPEHREQLHVEQRADLLKQIQLQLLFGAQRAAPVEQQLSLKPF